MTDPGSDTPVRALRAIRIEEELHLVDARTVVVRLD